MSLTAGSHLGPYEILALIGEGGMGQVYRARDTRLKRDVAVKVLPESLAGDADRVMRFQREAELLATLTHQHIAAIYGLEDGAGSRALIMELVEGPTIADRLSQGPIPVDEAVSLTRQLIEALDYAHERGVVHRDLKPANIKLTPDGHVKVLDFGLAKALDTATGIRQTATGQSISPTITSPALTQAGIILGTAAYMSPEQARGKPVDKRSDIWAFGCVVYEMLTGTRAFEGETISDTLAAILTREPEWSKLPASTPNNVKRLMRECLTRDSKLRLRDIGDARRVLDEPAVTPLAPSTASQPSRSMLPWAVAGALALALIASLAAWAPWKPAPARPAMQRHTVDLGVDATLATDVGSAATLSPDGRILAFAAYPVRATTTRLFVRRLDQLQAVPLNGTDDARAPFFSPDGQWIAFFGEGKLKRVSVNGGAPISLADAPGGRGGTWTESNSIIFLPQIGGGAHFVRVSASGGRPEEFIEPDIASSQRWPQILPGDKALLYSQITPGRSPDMKIQPLPNGPRKSLGEGAFARYVPSGHVLFLQNGTLYATRFDLQTLSLVGSAATVIEAVANQTNNAAQFASSDDGTLIYVSGNSLDVRAAMNWIDETGKTSPLRESRSTWTAPVFDPSGERLAFIETATTGNGLWVRDIARGVDSRIAEATDLLAPSWHPDGQRIAFAANRDNTFRNIYWQRVDGIGGVQRLTNGAMLQGAPAWHPDRRTLVYVAFGGAASNLMTLQLQGDENSGWTPGTPTVLFDSPSYQEETPAISPDGNWIAYVANDTGTREVYVRPFPGPGGAILISAGGGADPLWSRTRSELFFQSIRRGTEPSQIMVASFVRKNEQLQFDRPRPWSVSGALAFTNGRNFVLHPDGKRFVVPAVNQSEGATKVDKLVFVFNLFDELRRLTK